MSAFFESIGARMASNEPLTAADLDELAQSRDIVSLGMVADEARRRRHGARTTYVRVADVALDAGAPSWPATAGEIRIAGELRDWSRTLASLAALIRQANGLPVSAFTLPGLQALAASQRRSLAAVLAEARDAGLEWIAEAPIDRVDDPAAAFAAMREGGVRLARCTVATPAAGDPVALYRLVRHLVEGGADIPAFAPLARLQPSEPSTGYDDVKQVALARLVLDNVPSIQVDWALYGPKLAQVALTFGADDVDSVPAGDDPTVSRRRQPLEEIQRNIRAAMQIPVERNGRFEPIAR